MVPVAAVCMGCAHDNINPHKSLPRGERRYSHEKINEDLQLQSTLPHGKRPFWDEQYREETQASIHAPARGATVALFYLCPAMIFRAFFEQATYLDQFMQ